MKSIVDTLAYLAKHEGAITITFEDDDQFLVRVNGDAARVARSRDLSQAVRTIIDAVASQKFTQAALVVKEANLTENLVKLIDAEYGGK